MGFESRGLADQHFFDLGQQVVTAVKELDRFGQFVDGLVLAVGQLPG